MIEDRETFERAVRQFDPPIDPSSASWLAAIGSAGTSGSRPGSSP